jgi:putative phage-type endonuclease
MTEPTDFHERRRTGIGASDAAAALGVSIWQSPYGLWLEKLGQGEIREETEPMKWGRLLEPIIAAEYSRRTGWTIEYSPPMMRHQVHAFMIAHLDGRVDANRILEIKTARDGRGWGEAGTDAVPLSYLTQAHHAMYVSGATVCDVATLIAGNDFRIYEVHKDDDIARQIVEREAEFWRHVERREPPDPVNLHDAVARWGRLFIEGAVEAYRFELDAIESLRRIREERKMLDEAEEQAKLVVMQALGEHGDTLVDANGTRLATWALDKGRKGYTVEAREPQRRFLLKG